MVSRRRVAWCDFLMQFTTVDGAVRLDDLLTNAPISDTITVTRILGDFTVSVGVLSQVEIGTAVDIGIGVINQEAFDLGTGVGIPNPTVEDSTPPRGWLYVSRQMVSQSVPEDTGTPFAMVRRDAHFKFDLRGQRKVDKGVLFMWAEHNFFAGGTTTLFTTGRIRVLFKT